MSTSKYVPNTVGFPIHALQNFTHGHFLKVRPPVETIANVDL